MEPETVLILAGGRGVRLRPYTDSIPKVLLPVGGRPFIDYVLANLVAQGFRQFIFSVGYRGTDIQRHLNNGERLGISITYVIEKEPLGTGGAIRNAADLLPPTTLVVFGDVLLKADLRHLMTRHRASGYSAVLAAAWVDDRSRFGALELDGHRITALREKEGTTGSGRIFAGVFSINKSLILRAPAGAFPVTDLFSGNLQEVGFHPVDDFFIDMGTHESLRFLRRMVEPVSRERRIEELR